MRMYTPHQLQDLRKASMILAHALRREKGWTMSVSLRWAWKMVRSDMTTRIAGVTFGKRQEALKHLGWYAKRRKVFTLQHVDNEHDENAVAVIATVIGKGSAQVGFIPRQVAKMIAPLLKAGLCPRIHDWEVKRGSTVGLIVHMEIVAGMARSTPAGKQKGARIAVR